MLNSIKAIQAQQLYKVQPVAYNDGSKGKKAGDSDLNYNFFTNRSYNLEYPSVKGSQTLGRALDLRA